MAIRVLVRSKGGGRSLQLYYVDPDTGREVSKSSGTQDLREADKAAARWEDELLQHRGRDNDGWKHFRDRFREEHLAGLSRVTRASYGTALNHYQRIMAPALVTDIDASQISIFQAKLLAEERPATSIRNYLTHLRTALNFAESVGMIPKSPKIKMPRQQQRTFARARPVTDPEYRKMLKAAGELEDGQQWRQLLELLWLSGMRLGEALQLSWDRPPILADLDAKPYPQMLYYAEGHKARRDDAVPMTPELAAWMSKTPAKSRHGLVVPLPTACRRTASEQISAIGKAAGILVNADEKFASAHDLRRAFGTRWAQIVMPMTLQRLMRHEDISTTLKFYVGLSSRDAGRELWGAVAAQSGAAGVPKNVPKNGSKRRKAG